ncbi:MAG TPA: hypothetical protein PKA74_20510, partial [Bauldia sp.]|nr:hypothetical protein [Bauldia sp.]
GDSGYSYPIVVDGIPDARIRNIVGSLLGTDKAADFDLDQRTLDRLRAEEAESMEGLGPDEESDDAPGDTDASVPPAGDGEPEDAE